MPDAPLTQRLGATARRAHIIAAIEKAGGNGAVAAALGLNVNTPAQWKIQASVPSAYCERLVQLSHGLFDPALVRRNWEAERLAMQQLAKHNAAR